MAQENQNIPITVPPKKLDDGQQSDWSLSSIEQLKGLDLKQLQEQQDREQNPIHRQQKQAKQKVVPLYPPTQQITQQSKMHEVGKIISKIGQLLIVQSNSSINLVDFDNWLFNSNRECIGFVMDIFGRVDHPYYAIKLLQQIQSKIANWQQTIGVSLYYAQGCKTLTEDDIKSIKQKSSMYKEGDMDNASSSSEEQLDMDNQSQDQMRSNQVFRKKQKQPLRRKASYQQEPFHHRERTREKKHHHNQHRNQHHPHYNPQNNPHQRQRYDTEHSRRRHHDRYEDRQHAQIRDRHNQMYLESMYTMYYNQMMQLYNGQNGMPLPKPPTHTNMPMGMAMPMGIPTMPMPMPTMPNTMPQNLPNMPPMHTMPTMFPPFQQPPPQ